jgi:hypothetical protein
MNMNDRPRSILRRVSRFLLGVVAVMGVLAVVRCLYVFRDRNPGYNLAVNLDVAKARAEPRPLQVGFGRLRINPDISDPKHPVWMAGFSQNRAATGIHDDLWATATVLDDGHARLGIVAIDAIGFFHDDVIAVRRRVAAELKLDYVIVCSTHNHSTPDLMGLWGPDYWHTGVDRSYREEVISSSARALAFAVTNLQPAQVAFHEIPTNPEGLVTDTRKPKVFDPDIRFMHFTNPTNGATLGTVVGWADHPETVWARNTEITADFPGYLREALENGVRHDGVVLEPGLGGIHVYINGAVGGLMTTHPSTTVRDPYLQQDFKEPSHDKARALGHQLVSRIFTRLGDTNSPSASTLAQTPIRIRARTIELPLDNNGFLLAPLLGLIDRGHSHWKKLRTEVALVILGDASIACIPGEIYPELVNGGIEKAPGGDFPVEPVEVPPIRELMPGKVKFIFGLANDEIGYIIPKSEWDRKPPYLYDAKKPVYGEINSVGPETAVRIHTALRELCQEMGLSSPAPGIDRSK